MFFSFFARSDFLDLLLRSMSKPCLITWLDEILTARGAGLRRDLPRRRLVKWPAADVVAVPLLRFSSPG